MRMPRGALLERAEDWLTTASSLTAARERFLRKPKGRVWAAAAEAER